MRSPTLETGVRPPADHWVDRPDMQAPQGVKSTGTNRPSDLNTTPTQPTPGVARVPVQFPNNKQHNTSTTQQHKETADHGTHKPHPPTTTGDGDTNVSVVMAKGKHPVPSRTRKLSPPAPMVLHGRPCGRVGHRRTTPPKKREEAHNLFPLFAFPASRAACTFSGRRAPVPIDKRPPVRIRSR